MAAEHIATYLNDHLAGSVVGLELVEYLESINRGTPLERAFTDLKGDIAADRRELETLMSKLSIGESRVRKTAAWFTEKVTQLKLRFDDPAGGDFRLFEALEALSLGVEGKRLLWRAMMSIAADNVALQEFDLERLEHRAEEQRARIEIVRLHMAAEALSTA